MKNGLFLFFTVVSITISAQNTTGWQEVLLKPDLLAHFPKAPMISGDSAKQIYSCDTGDVILRITIEKNPLDYTGRSVEEVDKEYYDNLNQSILDKHQTLISQRDFKFDGQHVRELIYYDTLDLRPCRTTLQILNVIGWGDAMYKFYLIDFSTNDFYSENYDEFFQNWNLFYSTSDRVGPWSCNLFSGSNNSKFMHRCFCCAAGIGDWYCMGHQDLEKKRYVAISIQGQRNPGA